MNTRKNTFLGTLAILVITSFSFKSVAQEKVAVTESTIEWAGHKITGSHSGTINLKLGVLEFTKKTLTGGHITIDMPSIKVTDIKGAYAKKLAKHLKNDDFFGVETHPTTTLVFTKVSGHGKHYHITADLTIKGITEAVQFEMTVSENTATAKLKIDRTKYGIKYGSASFFDGLQDKAIYDEFDINVTIKF